MTESSLFWSSIAYSDDQFSDVLRKLFIADRTEQGVIEGYLGELACSDVASPVTVASGAAMVDGKFYENTANIDITITSPVSSTRIDRVVLRKDFTAETVTVELIAGTEGVGSPPALTQTDGTTWEIPLYQVSITTAGIISLTDERSYLYTANDTVWRPDNDGPDSGLNADLLDDADLKADTSLADNSDLYIPTQKAVKTYVDDHTRILSARAYKSGGQDFTMSYAKLTGWTESFDDGSLWDNGNSRVTIPTNGNYRISGTLSITSGHENWPVEFHIYKNGNPTYRNYARAYGEHVHFDLIDVFTAGDYLEIYIKAATNQFTWAIASGDSYINVTKLCL